MALSHKEARRCLWQNFVRPSQGVRVQECAWSSLWACLGNQSSSSELSDTFVLPCEHFSLWTTAHWFWVEDGILCNGVYWSLGLRLKLLLMWAIQRRNFMHRFSENCSKFSSCYEESDIKEDYAVQVQASSQKLQLDKALEVLKLNPDAARLPLPRYFCEQRRKVGQICPNSCVFCPAAPLPVATVHLVGRTISSGRVGLCRVTFWCKTTFGVTQ